MLENQARHQYKGIWVSTASVKLLYFLDKQPKEIQEGYKYWCIHVYAHARYLVSNHALIGYSLKNNNNVQFDWIKMVGAF